MTASAVLDAAGRHRSPATLPGYHAGRAPRNKGQLYPADPSTVEEIIAVMRSAGEDRHGARLRALVAVLWRGGLRIQEALALAERDLDPQRGSLLVRFGMRKQARAVYPRLLSPRRRRPPRTLRHPRDRQGATPSARPPEDQDVAMHLATSKLGAQRVGPLLRFDSFAAARTRATLPSSRARSRDRTPADRTARSMKAWQASCRLSAGGWSLGRVLALLLPAAPRSSVRDNGSAPVAPGAEPVKRARELAAFAPGRPRALD
jgi:hypothetical protein